MTRITIFSSHRAERGLLQPLINRLEAHPNFDLEVFSLHPPADFCVNYDGAHNRLERNPPDVVIIPCDRLEALAAALAAFNTGGSIIHFHAGDTGTVGADETYRHIISQLAVVHFCNGASAEKTVCRMLEVTGRSAEHVYNIGSTAFDTDTDLDTSQCADGPYDLILYHPPVNDPELIRKELDEIEETLSSDVPVFWGDPNGDEGSAQIIRRIEEVRHRPEMDVRRFKNLPRATFLGLMSKCEMFVGNSSSMIYEAPEWLYDIQIVHIGDRNRNRSHDDIQPGGSEKIVGILESIDWKRDFKIGNALK